MRGLHGTLAVERGATTHVVAQALGHESETTSRESYISREAITGADQRRVLTALAGATRSGWVWTPAASLRSPRARPAYFSARTSRLVRNPASVH
jgi:hypothetical protein